MMKRVLYVALLFATAANADLPTGFDQKFCQPPPNNGGRNFPKIPDEYIARLEWNNLIERRSLEMTEFISVPNQLGTAYITGLKAPGITTKYITSAGTGELFIIYDAQPEKFETGNCVVTLLNNTEEFAFPFKKNAKYPGTDTLLSGRSLLDLGASPIGNMMYNGTEMKNGILCDVWYGCLFVPSGQMTITVTYYFSVKWWHTAGGYQSSPVAIHAKGKFPSSDQVELEQVSNYAYFSTQWPVDNALFFQHVFETPENAYCLGRKNIYPLPDVPQYFDFRAEVIDSLASSITYTREYYDFKANYSRIDLKQPVTGNITIDEAATTSTIVNDFGTGVSYVINKFTGECLTLPISASEFDSVSIGGGMTRMRTPAEFFDFDHPGLYPYQYMGAHQVRNITADSWIAYRPFPHLGSPNNATWEWYFSTDETIIKAREKAEKNIPLKLVIQSTEANVDLTYNFFRFSDTKPDVRHFDVRSCFKDSGRRIFNMRFSGNWSGDDVEKHLELLSYWFQLSVDSFTGVRSIRVQDMQFEFFGKDIAVTFTMLGPAPIFGDVGKSVQQVPLDLATDRLVSSFDDGLFEIYFMPSDDPKKLAMFLPVKGSLHVVERNDNPFAFRPTSRPPVPAGGVQQQTIVGPGLNHGQAAGLAFGMLFMGVLLALVGLFIYKRKTASVPQTRNYVPQHNDE